MEPVEPAPETGRPFVIQYAGNDTVGDPVSIEQLRVAEWMIGLTILSGCCVGSWLVNLSLNREPSWQLATRILHVDIYACTLWFAVRARWHFSKTGGSSPGGVKMDCLAGIALVTQGVWPLLFLRSHDSVAAISVVGLSFVTLAATTYRHVLFYNNLATVCRGLGLRSAGRGLSVLGRAKAVFEAIWLPCCAVAIGADMYRSGTGGEVIMFLSVGAWLGLRIYAGLWVWSTVAHVRYFVLLRASHRRLSIN